MAQLLRKIATVATTQTFSLDTNTATGRKIRGVRLVNVDGAGYALAKKGGTAPAALTDDDCWILPKQAGAEVIGRVTEAQTAVVSIRTSASTVVFAEAWPGANE